MTNKKLAIITILLSSLPAAGQGYGGSGLRNIPADDSRTLQGGVRSEQLLTEWEFRRDHNTDASDGWEKVAIPHDWAIYGPFDRNNDLQEVAVIQNGEEVPTVKTGRSGGLPYMGKGCYRRSVEISGDALADSCRYILLFDGAMSEARVLVNGNEVCFWPYGYNSFHCDITAAVHPGENRLTSCSKTDPSHPDGIREQDCTARSGCCRSLQSIYRYGALISPLRI